MFWRGSSGLLYWWLQGKKEKNVQLSVGKCPYLRQTISSVVKGIFLLTLTAFFCIKYPGMPSWDLEMIGKFRHDGKISTVGIGKRPEKIPVLWKISLRERENVFRWMKPLVLWHLWCRPGFPFPFCISFVVWSLQFSENNKLFSVQLASTLNEFYSWFFLGGGEVIEVGRPGPQTVSYK